MTERLAAAVVLVVLVGVVAATPAAGGAVATNHTVTPTAANHTATPTANDSSESEFGASVSTFMQASAADAEGSVDTGMWSAAFDHANESDRARLVHQRTSVLEQRLERLEAERADLLNESDGNVTVRERAKAARLAAQAEQLREAINRTDDAARQAGVNATRLDDLRTQARNLTGPEVAALARNVTDRGPPTQGNGVGVGNGNVSVGVGTNGSAGGAGQGNQSAGGANGSDAGNANASDDGGPDDRGGNSDRGGDGGGQNQSNADGADDADGRSG